MAKGVYETKGFAEVAASLRSLGNDTFADKIVKDMLMKAALIIRDAVRREAPKKTGRLELFIGRTVGIDKNGQVTARVGAIRFRGKFAKQKLSRYGRIKRGQHRLGTRLTMDGYYGKFVEFGTKHQKANPFTLRAFVANKEAFTERLAALLKERLDKVLAQLKTT